MLCGLGVVAPGLAISCKGSLAEMRAKATAQKPLKFELPSRFRLHPKLTWRGKGANTVDDGNAA